MRRHVRIEEPSSKLYDRDDRSEDPERRRIDSCMEFWLSTNRVCMVSALQVGSYVTNTLNRRLDFEKAANTTRSLAS